ncbi:DUF1549 and DUF1553 domain-containing protein [Schlesneria paludicola]|uniref:DUF1549 and DUF1553 domain-containing protein n=1 Tax=Schlesneria paludicola TaxID=360056 RepID=UPI00029A2C1F|nr:DUF1549 and DUF1553 domain-containing protein [Schlesneria paludicola]
MNLWRGITCLTVGSLFDTLSATIVVSFREMTALVVCGGLLCTHSAKAADSIVILPAEIRLTGREAFQTVLVEMADGPLAVAPVRQGLEWSSANEQIARVIDGRVVPVANGSTTVKVVVNGESAVANVVVDKMDDVYHWNFRNQVQSVLSKTGCNSGACHGAAAGKNGFKLSLRGYDPEGDYFAITRQSRGRRVVATDPGRSLILTKPTAAIPHKGGLRFAENSSEYQVIAQWIAQGQQAPKSDDPRINRLEILPEASRLKVGTEQAMIVRAHFSDGHIEDVTRWAKYTSTNHAVCSVDDQGLVKVVGGGEGAIVAWYLAQNTTATITIPYTQPVAPDTFTSAERANFIDDLVLEKLAALNMPPSPRSDDSEFLRRVYLDTIGLLPTVDEVKTFLSDSDPLKRVHLIDSLLARPEFVDYWAYQWSDVLLLTGDRLRPDAIKAYYKWIRDRVAENVSWAEFARGIILAKGSTLENGAANFYALHQDPQDMVETTSMAFMGMSIQCAHCHDHPNEKWTNDDYYGMVSLFARVRGKGWGGDSRSGDGNRTIFLADEGEVLQPRTGRPRAPKPLDAAEISFDDSHDRRETLANWLTSPQNPYFAKAIVNRVWANFMGRGLVEAVDDLRLTNPASNEKLLCRLSEEFVRNQYDLKSLMRSILQSETYQRSHATLPENQSDQRFLSHSQPRRMKAEVLLDAISQVTGVATAFKDQPANTRAIQLPDANVASYFLDTFGRPERVLTCTCERSDEPSMTQVLHLTNGKTIQEKLESSEGRVSTLIQSEASTEDVIEILYLAAFARYPHDDERQRLKKLFAEVPAEERRSVTEDLFWSVLTSKEFLFQH